MGPMLATVPGRKGPDGTTTRSGSGVSGVTSHCPGRSLHLLSDTAGPVLAIPASCSLEPVTTLVTLRPMTLADLTTVGNWLRQPHVARWWTPESTAEQALETLRAHLEEGAGAATKLCLVSIDGQPAGWCQWYRWGDYPAEATAVDAQDGEVGADYAIGNADLLGCGFGTAMIAALISEVRRHHPGAGMVIAPEAANVPSRRILEKNGFRLESVRPLATERHDRPMAVYRLASADGDSASQR